MGGKVFYNTEGKEGMLKKVKKDRQRFNEDKIKALEE